MREFDINRSIINNLPVGLIPRPRYLSACRPFINQPLIKVLTGQRRVGKSYMLYLLIQELSQQYPDAVYIYLNKEDFAFDYIANADDLYQYVLKNSVENKMNFVLIDEIQDIVEFEKVLRSLLTKGNYDIYCTGSNAKLLSGDLATLLSGRYIEIRIYSLSYSEFLLFHGIQDTAESLMDYLTFGGMPQLSRLSNDSDVKWEYLRNLVNTIIYKDIINRYNVRNTRFLDQLIRFLADNVGSVFSAKYISDFLKSQHFNISHNQVQTYTNYLCNVFLVQRIERYDIIGKRIFETGEKFYFENIGIRNAIVGFRVEDIQKIIENAVYNHLLGCGYQIKTGQTGRLEIDFVAEKMNEKLYIQVAYHLDNPDTIEREFGNLRRIPDNYPKLVVSMDENFPNTSEGIRHLNLRAFLSTKF